MVASEDEDVFRLASCQLHNNYNLLLLKEMCQATSHI